MTVMIIILCCNKPIRWAASAVYSAAKTPDGHTVFSDRLVNCIFPWAKATSGKWSEVRCSGKQWVCYHPGPGRRTTNCNKPQLMSVVLTAWDSFSIWVSKCSAAAPTPLNSLKCFPALRGVYDWHKLTDAQAFKNTDTNEFRHLHSSGSFPPDLGWSSAVLSSCFVF